MNKNIDLANLLKDCPKGMELDCTMYENVTFVEVCKDTNTLYPIYCITTDENGNRSGCSFTKNGYASPRNSAKCVIFPKGKTTWEGFQRPFVDGDVVTDIEGAVIIYQKITTSGYCGSFASLDHRNQFIPHYKAYLDYIRLSTEEEKQKLFDVIKSHGYKWNADEKKLEKLIVPKFKVGDIIKDKCNLKWKVIDVNSHYYEVSLVLTGNSKLLEKKAQDDYELVPNKFDPKTLQPFDKVLVRYCVAIPWCIDFYSYYDEVEDYLACTGGVHYNYCIPYNKDTKHLVGKLEDAPDFYRYWEE